MGESHARSVLPLWLRRQLAGRLGACRRRHDRQQRRLVEILSASAAQHSTVLERQKLLRWNALRCKARLEVVWWRIVRLVAQGVGAEVDADAPLGPHLLLFKNERVCVETVEPMRVAV